MEQPTAAHARDLGDYVSLVRRRWAWIAGSAVVGLALGTAFLGVADRTYVSQAKVLVQQTDYDSTSLGERTNSGINLDTEAQLVKSEPVATRAARALDSDLTPVALANRVTVTVPPNTTVMVIAFEGPSAEQAQAGAAAFADAYLENREEAAARSLDDEVTRLNDLVTEAQEESREITEQLAALKPTADSERAALIARRSALSSRIASYNTALAPLAGSVVRPGEVIGEAQVPKAPVDPNPLLVLPSALMGGLLLGLGLAGVRERLDRRLHTGSEVERVFGLVPVAALAAGRHRRAPRLQHDVRALYHTLRASGPREGRERVLVVGPDALDCAQYLSRTLALVGARSGAPSCHVTTEQVRLELEPALAGATAPLLQTEDYSGLGVLVDGELRSGTLATRLDDLAQNSEFVVLDLPSSDPVVDIPALGRHVDIAVVVVRLGVTRRDSLNTVLATLTKSGVPGVLAVTFDLGRNGLSRRGVDSQRVLRGIGAPAIVPAEDMVFDETRPGEWPDGPSDAGAPVGEGATAEPTSLAHEVAPGEHQEAELPAQPEGSEADDEPGPHEAATRTSTARPGRVPRSSASTRQPSVPVKRSSTR